MSILTDLSESARAVAERVGPAVVGIGEGWGPGSGVVVAEGAVLTNAHNVGHDALRVVFPSGRTAPGQVAGVDVDGDLAVVTTDTGDTEPLAWAEAAAAPGDIVFAVANPAGRGVRVTFGLVSAVDQAFRGPGGRRIAGSVEHTAPLPRGSSGGPVVDAAGALLGVNTHRLGEGFYLAIPASPELRTRVESLRRGESPGRRRLGVALAPVASARRLRRAVGLPERDGLLVHSVVPGSPAERAGLHVGDLLVEAGGQALASPDDLHAALDTLAAGSPFPLHLVRGVDEIDVVVAFNGAAARAEGEA